jgi:hypothetical protein
MHQYYICKFNIFSVKKQNFVMSKAINIWLSTIYYFY